jgi:hypothetical protein
LTQGGSAPMHASLRDWASHARDIAFGNVQVSRSSVTPFAVRANPSNNVGGYLSSGTVCFGLMGFGLAGGGTAPIEPSLLRAKKT